VTLVVPAAAAGGLDILARVLQIQLQQLWKESVVVDYKPGGGTVLGTDYVAKSAPDGHTLGMVVTAHVINPALRKTMPYDTMKDLAYVSMTTVASILLSASPELPVRTLSDVIAYAKARPGKVSYATGGAGTAMHMAGELLKLQAGIDMTHVPYRGSSSAHPDVMSGRVEFLLDPLSSTLPLITAGKLRPIAILSQQRDPLAPEIPAATGAGLPSEFKVESIAGMVTRAGTPPEILARISQDVSTVIHSEAVGERLKTLGMRPVGSSPEEFRQFVRRELDRWQTVVKAANIKIE
jgi:tripartite-type tricarboxylate transporter receptor subunit TctC